MRPQIFAFFSGAGFLDLGFEAAGFELLFANEIRPSFLKGHQFARASMRLPEPRFGYNGKSISDFRDSPLLSSYLNDMVTEAKEAGRPVGFIGGPPCPDFSVGGKNRGRNGDNGKLSAVYVDLICRQQPDFFLFENVKGLWRTKRHREFFEELKSKLQRAGYATTERLINAIHYGAPQERERIILIGIRKNDESEAVHAAISRFPWERYAKYSSESLQSISWPQLTRFGEGSTKPSNVPEELTVEHWFKLNRVDEHPNSQHFFKPRAGLTRFLSVEEGDDSKKSFKRLHRWRFSPTACYGNNEVHLHPYKARRLSVAEALAIQSLPYEFQLPAEMTLSDMFKTVGNGVPFLAAKGIAESLRDVLTTLYAQTNGFESSESNIGTSSEPRLQLHQSEESRQNSDRQCN